MERDRPRGRARQFLIEVYRESPIASVLSLGYPYVAWCHVVHKKFALLGPLTFVRWQRAALSQVKCFLVQLG
jgi:hypothetical protein